MDTIVFADFTVGQLLVAACILVACMVAWSVLKKLFNKEKPSAHTQEVQCGCGWKGRVSVHAGRCPKCNSPIGKQLSRTY
jgi:hypothetical protein